MPFKSKAQQRWMFANHPEMAKRWAAETNFKKLPERVIVKKKKKKPTGRHYAIAASLHRSKAKPNKNAPLGQGGRFAAIRAKAAASGARNPDAVAAAAGIRKYGKKKMAKLAAAGRRR